MKIIPNITPKILLDLWYKQIILDQNIFHLHYSKIYDPILEKYRTNKANDGIQQLANNLSQNKRNRLYKELEKAYEYVNSSVN